MASQEDITLMAHLLRRAGFGASREVGVVEVAIQNELRASRPDGGGDLRSESQVYLRHDRVGVGRIGP